MKSWFRRKIRGWQLKWGDHFQAKEKRNHGQVWEQSMFYYREPEIKRGKKLHDIPEQNKKYLKIS